MSTERVPANAAALLLARVTGALIMVVVVSISAHRLSVGDFGLVVSTMAAGFLANTLVTFGTDTVVTRAIAAGRNDAASTTLASLRLQLGASLAFVIAALVGYAAGVAPAVVLIQAFALVPLAGLTVASSVLRGAQTMGRLLVATLIGGIVTLVVTGVGFTIDEAPWVPIAAVAAGSVASAAVAGWSARRALPRQSAAPVRLVTLTRETAPFAAMVVLAALGAQGGLLLVEFVADEPAGGYGAAVRTAEAARLVPAAAFGAFFPAMFDGAQHTDRYRRWMRRLFGYAALAIGSLWLAAGVINRLVFDEQPDGAMLIRILAISIALSVARLPLSFELIAEGRERSVLTSALAGTTLFLVAGVAVARRFGAIGIAWSQIVGLVVAVAMLAWARRSR